MYNYNINLYQFIYGVDIELNFNNTTSYDIKQWIPYRDGMNIYVTQINNYQFVVRLNLIYNDSIENKNILSQYFT